MRFLIRHRRSALFAIPVLLAGFSGCTTLYTAVGPPIGPAPAFSNWQIQTGSVITPAPAGSVFLAGAMQIQGSQVTGTFNTHSLCGTPQLLSYSGTYNGSTGSLTLADAAQPAALNVQLAVPSKATNLSVGTINALGTTCALALSSPGVGVEIPPLTGTYTGTVTSTNGLSGQVTLTLTQSATPNASAQFPVTGILSLSIGACEYGYYAPDITGTISGAAFTLADSSASPDTISGASAVGGATLPGTTIVFAKAAPCNPASTAFTGDLTRQ